MIQKTLKTTHGKLTIKIPSTIQELMLGQLMDLQQKPDLNDIEAISILSGITMDELYTVRNIADFQVFNQAVLSLTNQLKNSRSINDVPKTISFKIDKQQITINVINNLSVEPAGAFMAASDLIADEINNHVKQYGEDDWAENFNPSLSTCCQVLAHYFYCRATGDKYNEYKAAEFTHEIKKLRVSEAMPVAKHFFSCYPNLSKPKTGYFQHLHQLWNGRRALTTLKNSGISTP